MELKLLLVKKAHYYLGTNPRIALARLLYRDPEVLILDEFTNSLDPENEFFILNQLEKLKKEKKDANNYFYIK